MFLPSEENTVAIRNLLAKSGKIQCAVAFLGGQALDALSATNAKKRIVCNLDSGGTNPDVVEKLLALKNVEVRNQPRLHAKVYLGDEEAVVSSANLSANGLGLEDGDAAGWFEAGYLVREDDQLKAIRPWFAKQWKTSFEISDEDIARAKKIWRDRRHNRLALPKKDSLLEELRVNPDFFKDRRIFFTITRDTRSDAAEALLDELKIKGEHGRNLDGYEDWDRLPGNSYFIDLYYGPKSGFEFMGLFKADGKTIVRKNGVSLFLCHRIKSICGLKLSSGDKRLLKEKIALLNRGNEDASRVAMKDARRILFGV